MKYMIEYTIRSAGLTHDEGFAGSEALLTAFGKWKPEKRFDGPRIRLEPGR